MAQPDPVLALARIRDQVRAATSTQTPLRLHGGNTKAWYGNPVQGEPLDLREYAGIVAYDPAELVITARCGTPLRDIESALAASGQMLPFEPPHFGPEATLGGCVAAGLAGPRRMYSGAIRDFVLGATSLNGRGDVMHFGGQVIKNVAGYDVSRLFAGSQGTLGVLLEISIRLLPAPQHGQTLRFVMDEAQAIETMNYWAGKPLPLTASSWHQGELLLRLAGSQAGVMAATSELGGDLLAPEVADARWHALKEQTDPFFALQHQADWQECGLWRLAVPPTAPALALRGEQLIEWGGGQRWWLTDESATDIRIIAASAGGHATLWRRPFTKPILTNAFSPLAPALLAIHRRLKTVFDPAGIFNQHRLYPDF
ncbi:glycolate oxidase subunit GlcE [Silvimonas soli]|uniref:glycolate oxidase subunit GlcE n=1 Tax=Silvimonas soli TaxID=2980100 RepID=UPI0024B3B4D3|nr:glycolate oxidase subunit GlcE [Silvimonas soli]